MLQVKAVTYPKAIQRLSQHLKPFKLPHTKHVDGRIQSIKQEEYVIAAIRDLVAVDVPTSSRHWCDMFVYDETTGIHIPVNIKVTNGHTRDNIKSAKGIAYTFSTLEHKLIPNTLTMNRLINIIDNNMKQKRDPLFEYYFMFVNKTNGEFLIKSLCDIEYLYPNASNWLQACMNDEKLSVYNPTLNESYMHVRQTLALSLKSHVHNADALLT